MTMQQLVAVALLVVLHIAPTAGVGLAFSGGGIPGMLAALSQLEFLGGKVDLLHLNATISTASGGTLGTLLYHSATGAGVKLRYPPPLSASLSYDDLTFHTGVAGSVWWANAVNYLPSGPSAATSSGTRPRSRISAGTGRTDTGMLVPADDGAGWWKAVMHSLFVLGYGIKPERVEAVAHTTHVCKCACDTSRSYDACPQVCAIHVRSRCR